MAQAKQKTVQTRAKAKPKARKPAPKAAAKPRKDAAGDETREIFDHYDRDQNGSIDRGEFVAVCEALGAGFTDEEIAAGWDAVDSDGNGRISWKEFRAWWTAQ